MGMRGCISVGYPKLKAVEYPSKDMIAFPQLLLADAKFFAYGGYRICSAGSIEPTLPLGNLYALPPIELIRTVQAIGAQNGIHWHGKFSRKAENSVLWRQDICMCACSAIIRLGDAQCAPWPQAAKTRVSAHNHADRHAVGGAELGKSICFAQNMCFHVLLYAFIAKKRTV